MFEAFPKTRPELPPEYRQAHRANYLDNRRGTSPASAVSLRIEKWMHRQVARDVSAESTGPPTLEIGAGTLNHLRYEPPRGRYDIVEPFAELYEAADGIERVHTVYRDIAEIPLDPRYERIISIATFEHVCDLPDMVARCGLLLASGGRLRLAIPSEGTLLWALGWRCLTGLEFRLRRGLDYGVLMRHEHVNTAREIEEVLGWFFTSVRCRTLGPSRALSFYQFFNCEAPRIARCLDHLGRLEPLEQAA
jgi:hypothetical protein